jgi:hypothetical protein
MQQIRITKSTRVRRDRRDDDPLPLDPRDPDILKAKRLRRLSTSAGR